MESFQQHLNFLQRQAVKLRIDLLETLFKAQAGYLGGSLSMIEMLCALYYGQLPSGPIMNFDPSKPGWEDQDYFVLSKGHGSAALYAVLADLEFFDKHELNFFDQVNSPLQPYASKKVPGVALPAGVPGYGLSAAVGLAMSLKVDRQPNRVFVLSGDGELQNGQIWEAAMAASHYKLDNLVLLVDHNGLQMDGPLRGVMGVDSIADKFEAFGWKAILVNDGHDFEDLLLALEKAIEVQRRPAVIIARTVKGKGVEFAENKAYYHDQVLSQQEMAEALPRLKAGLGNF